jgi:hypothetical protein
VAVSGVAFAQLTEIERRTGLIQAIPLAVLYSPWLLGLLVIVLDCPGPIRNWLGPLLISLFYPALGFWYDWTALDAWIRHGDRPAWVYLVPVNGVLLFGFVAYVARMAPKRCPRCQRRSLIALLRLFAQEKRTVNTHWCASCGAQLWKDPEGRWQNERRQTWLDAAELRAEMPAAPEAETA